MKINKGYKYKLIVNKEQKQLLFNHIFNHNQTWNILLNESIKQFENNEKLKLENKQPVYLNSTQQDNIVKKILRERKLNINTKVLQQRRKTFNEELNKTIKKFVKGTKCSDGMLKFKSSKDFNNQGFETTKEQYKILEGKSEKYKILRLFNESFKIRWSRDFPLKSEYKTINISYKNGHFYISFNVSYDLEVKRNKFNKLFHESNGNIKNLSEKEKSKLKSCRMDININDIDLGNKSFHKKFSTKDIKEDNLQKKNKKKLDLLQRKQSKRILKTKKNKIKIGKNFYKTQLKINKILEKNSNKKMYNLYKIINKIIKEIKLKKLNHLIVEDLNVKEMTKKTTDKNKIKLLGKKKTKTMKKNILHISFGIFVNILKYKCAENEIYFSLINPKDTSKTCSSCTNLKEDLELKDRIYDCKICGLSIDRDYNSVLNILNKSIV